MPSGGWNAQGPCKLCGHESMHHSRFCRDCYNKNQRFRLSAAAPRTRDKDKDRAWKLGRLYGITLEDFDAMLAAQGGCCIICNTADPHGGWAIDHDHSCCPNIKRLGGCGNCTRGILCSRCNLMLGNARDNSETLMAGAAYLLSRVNVLQDVGAA
jgi:hypothetical protein